MAFRYINPGYKALLDKNCISTEVTNTEYSKTGVAFSQTNSSAGVTIPTFSEGDDFWAKFGAYIPSATAVDIYLLTPKSNSGLFVEIYRDGRVWLYQRYNGNNVTIAYGNTAAGALKFGAVNNFVVHIKLGTSADAVLEFSINGQSFSNNGRTMTYSESLSAIARIYSTSANVFFSNLIFSNEEISPKEMIITLPTSETVTNMTAGASGLFIADAANQTLFQTVDVATLIENYGASSAVTGIALVGNPAYATGTELTSLIGLSKSGASIIEHGTCDLSDDTEATIVDGWSVDDKTIADLQGMQFGWKAGE